MTTTNQTGYEMKIEPNGNGKTGTWTVTAIGPNGRICFNYTANLTDAAIRGAVWLKLAEALQLPQEQTIARLEKTWNETLKAHQQQGATGQKPPRLIPAFKPFPLETLPAPLRSFVSEGAKALLCEPALIAVHALAVVGAAIGTTRMLRLNRTWKEPALIWTAAIAETGDGKTHPYKLATRHLWDYQVAIDRQHNTDLDVYDDEAADYQRERRRKKSATSMTLDKPARPVKRTVLASNLTIEVVAQLLADCPRGFLVGADELDTWVQSLARYRSGGTSDLPLWLELHSGGNIKVDRKSMNGRSLSLTNAYAGVTGTIQPLVFKRALDPERMAAGLGARFFLTMPEVQPVTWTELELHPNTEQGYEQLLDSLLGLGFDQAGKPQLVDLSPEAKSVWVEYHDRMRQRVHNEEQPLKAALSKLIGGAARLALLLHMVERHASCTVKVSRDTMQAGIDLAEWFALEAERVYGMLAESPEEYGLRRLVELIRKRGNKITARKLQRANCRKYPTQEAAQTALDSLADAGLGEWTWETPLRGGHAFRCLSLCMTHDARPLDDDEDD